MGDYLRLLTVNDRDIPLATLQRAVPSVAIWSVDHPGVLGNYLAIGPELGVLQNVWVTIERNPVGPNTLGAEEVAEFIDSLDAGGPPSAVRWLSDYLETIRAIYAIRIYPEAIVGHPEAEDAVYAVRSALRDAVGGIGQWDGHGFTNRRRPLDLVRSQHGFEGNHRGGAPRRVDRRVDSHRAEPGRSRRTIRASSAARCPSGTGIASRPSDRIVLDRTAIQSRRCTLAACRPSASRARSPAANPASGGSPIHGLRLR